MWYDIILIIPAWVVLAHTKWLENREKNGLWKAALHLAMGCSELSSNADEHDELKRLVSLYEDELEVCLKNVFQRKKKTKRANKNRSGRCDGCILRKIQTTFWMWSSWLYLKHSETLEDIDHFVDHKKDGNGKIFWRSAPIMMIDDEAERRKVLSLPFFCVQQNHSTLQCLTVFQVYSKHSTWSSNSWLCAIRWTRVHRPQINNYKMYSNKNNNNNMEWHKSKWKQNNHN